jgi:geranylgeranyl reductase family protein
MKCVAVLGGGPAGAFAAEQLASAGLRVLLFDEKLAWEKPCGGGLSAKAWHRYPFLIDNLLPKRFVTELVVAAQQAKEVRLKLDEPLLIYSRFDLNRMLLERADRAGAQIEKARVTELARQGSGWRLLTSSGAVEADFCILATGARNPLRDFGARFGPADTMSALGYYIPGSQEHIDIQFLPQLHGYIWIFPRCGHLSVGICGKGEPAASLRRRLEQYMTERGLDWTSATFYSHVLPSLDSASWSRNRVAGEGWMAVGDAAGLVDPITGEGLYYAIRSAEFAARAVVSEQAGLYAGWLREDFTGDLELAARLASRVYLGSFLARPIPERTVQFSRYSPRFAQLVLDLVAGRQPYSSLKRRLWTNLGATSLEILRNVRLTRSAAPPSDPPGQHAARESS